MTQTIKEQEPFVQQIRNKDEIKWTFDELRDKLICDESINSWYVAHWDDCIYNPKNAGKKYDGEDWNILPDKNHLIRVSNLGRIEIDKKIVTDYYEANTDGNWKHEKISPALLQDPEKRIGYLVAQIPDSDEFLNKYVYSMVAEAWLKNYGDGHIHHITNDGYDNRPENLIILNAQIHHELHSGKMDLAYAPGTYKK